MNYTVKSGDTLSKIAAAYGVTVAAIAAANNIANVNVIAIGRVLTIPGNGVTINSAGQVVTPQAGGTTQSESVSFIEALARAATRTVIDIETAKANRKIAIANGTPMSTVPAENVGGVQTQSDGASQSIKWLLIGLTAAFVVAAVSTASGSSTTKTR